jgi:hypothetical protein
MINPKKITVLVLFLFLLTGLYTIPEVRIRYTFMYDSNVFLLSERDLDRFTQGDHRYDFINTSDDFIHRVRFRFSDTFRSNSITFTPWFQMQGSFNASNYTRNHLNIFLGFNTRLNRFTANNSFSWSPDSYTRDWYSTIFDEHSFTFNRLTWNLNTSYRFHNLAIPLFMYRMDFHYKHPEERWDNQDGMAQTFGAGWRFIAGIATIELMYQHRDFRPNFTDDRRNPGNSSHIYEVSIQSRRFFSTLADFRINASYRFEERVFHEDRYRPEASDPYSFFQTNRRDYVTTVNAGIEVWLSRTLSAHINYMYRFRDTRANSQSVIDERTYNKFQISTSLEWRINL